MAKDFRSVMWINLVANVVAGIGFVLLCDADKLGDVGYKHPLP